MNPKPPPGALSWESPIGESVNLSRRPPLSDSDRAELCSRVDFLAVLAGDGVEARKSGTHYVCRLRPNDKTPSCYVWPPDTGKRGAEGWTWHDYGDGRGGDALEVNAAQVEALRMDPKLVLGPDVAAPMMKMGKAGRTQPRANVRKLAL